MFFIVFIDVFIIFDVGGVLSYFNYILLYYGVKEFVGVFVVGKVGWVFFVDFYILIIVLIVCKYFVFFDVFFILLSWVIGVGKRDKKYFGGFVFFNGLVGYGSFIMVWKVMIMVYKS